MGPSGSKVVRWEGLLKESLGHRCSLTRLGPSCRLPPVSGLHRELWALFPPTGSSVGKHSTFCKQAALRKTLANSGGRFSPLYPTHFHKSRCKTNSRSLFKTMSEINKKHSVLLLGVLAGTDNQGFALQGALQSQGLAAPWSHCLACEAGLGAGRTCPCTHTDHLNDQPDWVFTGETFSST